MRVPKILNDIVDKVLAYKPKARTKAVKRRRRKELEINAKK